MDNKRKAIIASLVILQGLVAVGSKMIDDANHRRINAEFIQEYEADRAAKTEAILACSKEYDTTSQQEACARQVVNGRNVTDGILLLMY